MHNSLRVKGPLTFLIIIIIIIIIGKLPIWVDLGSLLPVAMLSLEPQKLPIGSIDAPQTHSEPKVADSAHSYLMYCTLRTVQLYQLVDGLVCHSISQFQAS
jgi:hypothetical protein